MLKYLFVIRVFKLFTCGGTVLNTNTKRLIWNFCWLSLFLSGGVAVAQDVAFEVLPPAVEQKQEEEKAEAKIGPIFKDGLAQVVPEFKNPADWIRHDLFVETEFDSDENGENDRMHVSVVRQKQTETEGLKVPVVYNTSPYFCGTGDTGPGSMWDPKHELNETPPARKGMAPVKQKINRPSISSRHTGDWVPLGFAMVHSCSPGTGLSQGCPTVGGQNEALAPKAVVDWLCGRAKGYTTIDGDEEVVAYWCTGKVGMTGTSYNGTLPLACATTGVEGLEAIIPVAPNTSYYHYYRSHGLVRHPGGYMGEDIDVLYDFIHSGDPEMRDCCNQKVRDTLYAENMDRVTGDYNDFWAGRDYLNQLDSARAALLMSHGFNDWNVMPEHSVRIYEAFKERGVPCQAYFHQGGHGGPPPMELKNKWFTRYLYDVENGVEDDPRSWIVRERKSRLKPTPYAEYPNPEAAPVKFHLSKGGNESGGLVLDAVAEQGVENLTDDVALKGGELAALEQSDNRLLFVTPELKSPLHLSGYSTLSIKMACDKPACNLSVWVVSLPWKSNAGSINENVITRGWADPQNRGSLTESDPLTPNEFVEFSFKLQPDDQIIPAGQKIGLMIFSSDREFTLWPDAGTKLMVDLDGTSIEMPVVGGVEAFKAATEK